MGKRRLLGAGARATVGVFLASKRIEHHMFPFRAVVVSVALTLAVGQNASLLCKVWCHDATSAGCPHQDSTTAPGSTTSPSVSADHTCGSGFVGPVAFVREDGRRTAGAPDAQNALVVPRLRLTPSATHLRLGFELGRRLLLEERPLVIALRI